MNVLLVGSSFSAIPLLRSIQRLGGKVTVVGNEPSDPCHLISDGSVYADYSEPSNLAQVWESNDFDFIVPSCNDSSYLSASVLANRYGLPGFDGPNVVEVINRKHKFRKFCADFGIPSPKLFEYATGSNINDLNQISFPVLVKPSDAFSGKGISFHGDRSTIHGSIESAMSRSRIGVVLIEEFVSGTLHSASCFIRDGSIHWLEIVDEFCVINEFQVDRSSFPSALRPEMRIKTVKIIEQMIDSLELVNGLFHVQFIQDGKHVWIIETMRRCPGDLYGKHFELIDVLNYHDCYVSSFLDMQIDFKTNSNSGVTTSRVVMTEHRSSNPSALEMNVSGESQIHFFPLKTAGQTLLPAPEDKFGIVFVNQRMNNQSTNQIGMYYGNT